MRLGAPPTHATAPTARARRRWDDLKVLPDEVLLRKAMLEDIEALTSLWNYEVRWGAYEILGRLANQHFGPYNAFHGREDSVGREESQRLWRLWAKDGITRSRIDWIYEGFARSGIALPQPMDANGIDRLIAVLEYYGDLSNRKGSQTMPVWSVDGGWVKANFHRYNANWLLERFTGYAEMLSKVPSLRLPPQPLALTIRPAKEVHVFTGKEPLTIVIAELAACLKWPFSERIDLPRTEIVAPRRQIDRLVERAPFSPRHAVSRNTG